MPYKTIQVDGKPYEYFLGKKNLMVKGVGRFSREERNIQDSQHIIEIIREVCLKDQERAEMVKQYGTR